MAHVVFQVRETIPLTKPRWKALGAWKPPSSFLMLWREGIWDYCRGLSGDDVEDPVQTLIPQPL